MPETSAKTRTQKKNPLIATIASFFIPGLGQSYDGEARRGIGFLIMAIIFASLWLSLLPMQHMAGAILVTGGAYALIWIGSMYDAYKTAKEINSKI